MDIIPLIWRTKTVAWDFIGLIDGAPGAMALIWDHIKGMLDALKHFENQGKPDELALPLLLRADELLGLVTSEIECWKDQFRGYRISVIAIKELRTNIAELMATLRCPSHP